MCGVGGGAAADADADAWQEEDQICEDLDDLAQRGPDLRRRRVPKWTGEDGDVFAMAPISSISTTRRSLSATSCMRGPSAVASEGDACTSSELSASAVEGVEDRSA